MPLTNILSAILLVPSLFLLFTQASSTSPDLVIFAIGIVTTLYLSKLIFNQNSDSQAFGYLLLILILSIVGITIKLSYIAMAGLSVIVAAGVYYRDLPGAQGDRLPQIKSRPLFILVSAIVIILGFWVIRGYILSGYPSYPANIGGLPFIWQIPENQVTNMERGIGSWARWPGMPPDEAPASWNWLGPWIERMGSEFSLFLIPVAMSLIGFIMIIALRKRLDRLYRWKTLFFLLPSIGSVLFWFFTAPDPRFAGASLYTLGAGLLAASINVLNTRISRLALYFFLFLCCLMIGIAMFRSLRNPERTITPLPEPSLIVRTTDSGLVLFIPASGDQCWDAPLPCTPHFNPKLKAINNRDLSSGFTLDTTTGQ